MAKDENYDEEDQSVSESFNIWWAISGVGYALAILFMVMFFMKGGSGDATKLQAQVKALQAQLASSGKPQAGPAGTNLKALIKGMPAWQIEKMFTTKQTQDMFFHLLGEKNMGRLTNLVTQFGKDAETHFQNVVLPLCKDKALVTDEIRDDYKKIGYGFNAKTNEFAPLMKHLNMQPGTAKNLNPFDKICVYFKHVTAPYNKVKVAAYTGEALAVGAVAAMTAADYKLHDQIPKALAYCGSDGTYLKWGWTIAAVVTVFALVCQLLRSYNMLCFKKSD